LTLNVGKKWDNKTFGNCWGGGDDSLLSEKKDAVNKGGKERRKRTRSRGTTGGELRQIQSWFEGGRSGLSLKSGNLSSFTRGVRPM